MSSRLCLAAIPGDATKCDFTSDSALMVLLCLGPEQIPIPRGRPNRRRAASRRVRGAGARRELIALPPAWFDTPPPRVPDSPPKGHVEDIPDPRTEPTGSAL